MVNLNFSISRVMSQEYLIRIVVKNNEVYVAISYLKYNGTYEKLKEGVVQFLKQLFGKVNVKQISHYEYILS